MITQRVDSEHIILGRRRVESLEPGQKHPSLFSASATQRLSDHIESALENTAGALKAAKATAVIVLGA